MSGDELFDELEPPPGGAQRFAQRLKTEGGAPRATRLRGLALAAAAAVVAVAVAIVLVVARQPGEPESPVAEMRPLPNIYEAPEFDRLLGRPLPAAELTATVDQRPSTLTELESQNRRVRIYRIE